MWLRSLGSCYHRYCWSFSRLGVDGWLLSALNTDVMESVLGVDDKRARAAILGALNRWEVAGGGGRDRGLKRSRALMGGGYGFHHALRQYKVQLSSPLPQYLDAPHLPPSLHSILGPPCTHLPSSCTNAHPPGGDDSAVELAADTTPPSPPLSPLRSVLGSSSTHLATHTLADTAVELYTMPPSARDVLLRDVFTHYDRDQSGDLDGEELQQLLAAAGLGCLTEGEVRTI